MRKKRTTDWIIAHDGTQGELAYALECTRCGDIQKVSVPIAVSLYVAMGKAYVKLHSQCKPKREDDEPQVPSEASDG